MARIAAERASYRPRVRTRYDGLTTPAHNGSDLRLRPMDVAAITRATHCAWAAPGRASSSYAVSDPAASGPPWGVRRGTDGRPRAAVERRDVRGTLTTAAGWPGQWAIALRMVGHTTPTAAPPPVPSSPGVSTRMSAARRADTGPEKAPRSELRARGLRFRLQRSSVLDRRRPADITFPKERVAAFVDGCFWHGCPVHGTDPRANAEWWGQELARNRERAADRRLSALGWAAVRVWEHEDLRQAASRAEEVVLALRRSSGTRPVRKAR